ncbi:hypothetical protein P4S60_07665 [Pseudoalteromonas sp. Hal040]|uniref:hypothetical protein n=1 Tax=unclassified Pseudoalteromonas TaxID=194690 RepID=UPI00301C953E
MMFHGKWMNYIPHWSFIKGMADIKLVKISYIWIIIVPILAKALNEVSDSIPITIGNVVINFNVALPFSWQLFFFSALTFSMAQFLYTVFCPEVIKKYKNVHEFREDGKTIIQLGTYLKALLLDRKARDYKTHSFFSEHLDKQKLRIEPKHVARAYLAHLKNRETNEVELTEASVFETQTNILYVLNTERYKAIFEFTSKIFDVQKPMLRVLILLFYLIGFLLSLLVLKQNIESVIQTII